MNKWVKRILIGIGVLTILGALGTYVVVENTLSRDYGERVKTVTLDTSQYQKSDFVLTNVNVLAPTADQFLAGRDVRVEDGLIVAVGENLNRDDDISVIDGKGLYLIPGLTDSHIHLWRSENDLLLYVANGVTQVRELHGTKLHLQWREEIENGRIGPDIHITAAQLATYGPFAGAWVGWTAERNIVRSKNDVQKTVSRLKQEGYDAIKASSFLSRDGFLTASDITRDNQIPLVGHIPLAVSLDDLFASNQKEVAHVEEFFKALDREFGVGREFSGYTHRTADEFLEYVQSRSDDIAQRVVENDITVTSTLALINSFAPQIVDVDSALEQAQLDYVNPGLAEGRIVGWLPDNNRYRVPDEYRTEGWRERQSIYWTTYAKAQQIIFEALLAHDAVIMAGTDANVPTMVPGFSLHDELEALSAAGMNNAEILASATTVPAEWMDWNVGQISPGYKANLMLLRENPLEDISATQSIESVFVNGHHLTRIELDQILERVRRANSNG